MSKADAVWVLGLMSGTSMDGVDGAMLLTDGCEVFEFGATGFRPYGEAERATIAAAQGCWPGEPPVAAAADVVTAAHAELAARFEGFALVGFHGQTLAHEPRGRGTHQAGEGARLARRLGRSVAWDFRAADVAAGGEGAPLAPFFHHALARRNTLGRVAVLNLGGVGNITFVDAARADPAEEGAVLAFDTGPANALMDDCVRARTGLRCDYGGVMAAAGRADAAMVSAFLAHPFFSRKPPKSLDRNQFTGLLSDVAGLSDADALATLAEASVQAVAAAMDHAPHPPERVLVAGGGRKNAHLMARLGAFLPCVVEPVEAAGFDGDMLEAQAFAYLAVRVQRALPLSAPATTGVARPVTGGRISAAAPPKSRSPEG